MMPSEAMSAKMRSVLLAAAVPSSAPDIDQWDGNFYPTTWFSVIDYDQRLFYWNWYYGNLNTIHLNLSDDFWSQTKTMYLNPRDKTLTGDVTHAFSSNRTMSRQRQSLR